MSRVQGHGCSNDWVCPCCNASVMRAKRCAKGANLSTFQFLSCNYWLTLEIPHGAGYIGHLVIMTFSFSLYCPCIISSIRAEIIDSPFMLMLWIWSVDKQILSNVVFWAWHLKWSEESVRFQSDSRMFCLSLSDSLGKRRKATLVLTNIDNKQDWDLQMYFTTACLGSFTLMYQLMEVN